MPITSGKLDNEIIEESLEKAKEKLYVICNGYIAGQIKGASVRDELKKINKSINDVLSFYSIDQQEKFKSAYKYEIEFIARALNIKNKLSDVITPEIVNYLSNRDAKDEMTIYKQDEEINKKIDEFEDLRYDFYDSESMDEEELYKYLTKVSELKNFFNESSKKLSLNKSNDVDIKDKFDLVTDKLHEVLILENYMQISLDNNIIANIEGEPNEEQIEEIKKIHSETEKRIEFCEKRLKYYNSLFENDGLSNEEIENIENSLEEIEELREASETLLAEVEQHLKEIEEIQPEEKIKEDIEEDVITEEVEPQEEKLEETPVFESFELEDLTEEMEHPSLEEDEYFESLLNSQEGIEEPEELDVEIDIDELEFDEEETGEEITDEQDVDLEVDEEVEETPEITAVSKRVNDMISKRDTSSKKSIKNELDDLYNEMLAPKKKKRFFQKEKKRFYGDISEDIFMDIRSVFACINMEDKFLEEDYADEFAKKIFNGGTPHYMLDDMDEKTNREFLVGMSKYIQMCESDKFTQREKENFEKFVLQPFRLKHMQKSRKEKDFFDELEEETISREEIVKTKSNVKGDEIKLIDINKEK